MKNIRMKLPLTLLTLLVFLLSVSSVWATTSISIAGGRVQLSSSQLTDYNVTVSGNLNSGATLIFPNGVTGQWNIANNASGPIALAYSSQAVPITIASGATQVVYGNGTGLFIVNLTGTIDVSAQLVPSTAYSAASAANCASVVNGAIVAASTGNMSTVAITVPGTYYCNQIVMYSNSNLSLGSGVILRKPPGVAASMIINEGALQATPATDSNIQIFGEGEIDGNNSNQTGFTRATNGTIASNTFLSGIQGEVAMIGVNNFVFALQNVYNCNGFGVQYIGNNALFQNIVFNTARDALHFNGPSSHIILDNVTGYSADAFIALNAWDYHISSPTVGNITDVRATNIAYYGSNMSGRTGGLLVLLPGTRTTGYGQGTGNISNVSMDGFVNDMTQGTVTPQSAGIQLTMTEDTVATEYSGTGSIDNVTLKNGYSTYPNGNTAFLKASSPPGLLPIIKPRSLFETSSLRICLRTARVRARRGIQLSPPSGLTLGMSKDSSARTASGRLTMAPTIRRLSIGR